MKFLKLTLLACILLIELPSAQSFSLIGPPFTWQTARLGYDATEAPMPLGSEYRLTAKTITYGFTPQFVQFFGQRGMDEIEEAIQVFNDLGDLSVLDPNSYPLRATRFNATAFQLQLVDLKSLAMTKLARYAGLSNPERYVFTLRFASAPDPSTVFTVIQRNYDPVTYEASSHINGHLKTYSRIIYGTPAGPPYNTFNIDVDPLADQDTSVAGSPGSFGSLGQFEGKYFNLLSRDDVGGLKYLYRSNNYNIETLPTGTTASTGGGVGVTQVNGGGTGSGAWTPVTPLTNAVTTPTVATNLVDAGLRPGLGQLNFQRVEYDFLFGQFLPVTIRDSDVVITNGFLTRQTVERVLLTGPDVIFDVNEEDTLFTDDVLTFTSFDALTAVTGDPGPGSIGQAVQMEFSNLGRRIRNIFPDLSEFRGVELSQYGSFDGSSNVPFVYPDTESLLTLEEDIIGAGGAGIAWIPVPALAVPDPNDPNNINGAGQVQN